MSEINSRPTKLNESEWLVHLQAWKASQLSAVEYCRRHQLEMTRFKYWHYKLMPADKKPRKMRFAQVIAATQEISHKGDLIVEVKSYRLLCRTPLNAVLINGVLDILEKRP